jgi:hypothetical protein
MILDLFMINLSLTNDYWTKLFILLNKSKYIDLNLIIYHF